jgi:hypothetical protein
LNARAAWAAATLLLILLAAAPHRASADELSTKLIPLPMYATTPNEGSTYGVLPVFLRTSATGNGGPASDSDTDTGAVYSITAPSISWNAAAGVNGTFRYFRYINPVQTWSLIAAVSTHINRTLWFTYDNLTREPHDRTLDAVVMVRRNLFFRYFGLGPDTPKSGESSYTRLTATANGRWGYNFTPDLNLGAYGEVRADQPERHAVFNLPLTQNAYPDAPGINGASIGRVGLTLRFDTRVNGDYAERGLNSELAAYLAHGISGVGFFGQFTWQARVLVPQYPWLQLAARSYWTQLVGSGIPFYYRASLGGEFLLRGYPDDRFIAMGAWEGEVEERIRFLQTHFFDVTADWRVDPFVDIGQVYDQADIFSHVRIAGGLGLRAFIHPNVLGRIDVAYGDEGLRVYVMLGYPY